MVGFAFFGLCGGVQSAGIPPGTGWVMDFCVAPPFRHRGFATEMNRLMEDVFRGWGIADVYLTPDPVTGKPFWASVGYTDTRRTDPDNRKPIYVKTIRKDGV